MKIRSLTIPELHHFKDFTLDFTYPKGHEKEGQPLDKVCFIGQSGTGKSTLLRLIKEFSSFRISYFINSNWKNLEKIEIEITDNQNTLIPKLEIKDENTLFFALASITKSEVSLLNAINAIKVTESKLTHVFFPAESNYNFQIDDDFKVEDLKKVIDFSEEKPSNIWKLVHKEIQKHQEHELVLRQEISKVAETGNFNAIQQSVKKLEAWKSNNRNPVIDVAEKCLNPILIKFGLRVKTDLDIQRKEDIGFIKVEDFEGNEIPHGLLSTGTKQVLMTALPLYLLNPQKTLIFIDEPERSLYPDVQREVVDFYSSLTTDSQFFYATHSPIIASSFEPWEIVELKFDKNWNIYRDLYYEGENHVDNYFIDPRYLNYDLMLKKIFDLKNTNTDFRTDAIMELTMIKNKLEKLKLENKLKTDEGKEIFKSYQNLSKKLVWETA